MMISEVGILLSLFNPDEQMLSNCLRSISRQTFERWHLYIILDGITISQIPLSLSSHISVDRLTLIENQRNLGLTESLNLGSDCVVEKYIARIDDDDEWLETHLEDSINVLERSPKVVLTGSFFYLKETNLVKKVDWASFGSVLRPFIGGSYFAHSTLVFRKKIFKDFGGYSLLQKKAQDRELICALVHKYGMKSISYTSKYNVFICVRENSLSRTENQRLYSIIARVPFLVGRLTKSEIELAKLLTTKFLKLGLKNKLIVATIIALILLWRR